MKTPDVKKIFAGLIARLKEAVGKLDLRSLPKKISGFKFKDAAAKKRFIIICLIVVAAPVGAQLGFVPSVVRNFPAFPVWLGSPVALVDQVGIPPTTVSTCPEVPIFLLANVFVPEA